MTLEAHIAALEQKAQSKRIVRDAQGRASGVVVGEPSDETWEFLLNLEQRINQIDAAVQQQTERALAVSQEQANLARLTKDAELAQARREINAEKITNARLEQIKAYINRVSADIREQMAELEDKERLPVALPDARPEPDVAELKRRRAEIAAKQYANPFDHALNKACDAALQEIDRRIEEAAVATVEEMAGLDLRETGTAKKQRRSGSDKEIGTLMRAIAPAIGKHITETLGPIMARLDALESRKSATYAGVWRREVEYPSGSFVSFRGSMWVSSIKVKGIRPGDGRIWTLTVKNGHLK